MRVVGGLLLAGGLLIAAVGVLVILVLDSQIGSGADLRLALLVGGPPLAIGLLSAWSGVRILRRGRP